MAGIRHYPCDDFSAVRLLRDMDGDGAQTELEGRRRACIFSYSWVRALMYLMSISGCSVDRGVLSAHCWLISDYVSGLL